MEHLTDGVDALLGHVVAMVLQHIPTVCAMVTVGQSCEVHLLIKGLVEAHKEIKRLNGLIGEKQSSQRKLLENTQAGDYEKVPIEVRDANKEKVRRP